MSDEPKNISLVTLNAESLGDAAKEAYNDCLKPAAQATGQLISLAPRSIRALLSPLEKWILNKESALEETSKILAEKLSSVPSEKIASPEPYVAVPALQAISYSAESPDLRELFANLLATSMNIDTKNQAHPAFVEIIKQLSPLEAKLLKETSLLAKSFTPCCQVRFQILPEYSSDKNSIFQEVSEGFTVVDHFVIFDTVPSPNDPFDVLSPAITNFVRLGLCEIPFGLTLSDSNAYSIYENYSKLDFMRKEAKKKYSSATLSSEGNLYLIKETIRTTALGMNFYKFCVE